MSTYGRVEKSQEGPKLRRDWYFLKGFESDGKNIFLSRTSVCQIFNHISSSLPLPKGMTLEEWEERVRQFVDRRKEELLSSLTADDREVIHNWNDYALEREW